MEQVGMRKDSQNDWLVVVVASAVAAKESLPSATETESLLTDIDCVDVPIRALRKTKEMTS